MTGVPAWVRITLRVVAAILLLSAGLHLVLGQDKGLGIFLVIIAVIFARVAVLNVD